MCNENTALMAAPTTVLPSDITEYDYNSIIEQAERAEALVAALNKMMNAAIRITTYLDWVLIGGKPYLQESGATKVGRLFGIGWKILDVQQIIDKGYPAFTYRMAFRMGNNEIECEGSRSGADDFFAGKGEKRKNPDEISALDVKKAAYTNCLNNGIKRMLPGLRNIDIASLEAGGINTGKISGYSFRGESKAKASAPTGDHFCAQCGMAVSSKVASFSEGKFGRKLCMNCQKTPKEPVNEAISIDDYTIGGN